MSGPSIQVGALLGCEIEHLPTADAKRERGGPGINELRPHRTGPVLRGQAGLFVKGAAANKHDISQSACAAEALFNRRSIVRYAGDHLYVLNFRIEEEPG